MERAIRRAKNYGILKGAFPISMIRIANQIVCVCAWLTNFQPALIPPSSDSSVEEVDENGVIMMQTLRLVRMSYDDSKCVMFYQCQLIN